MHRPRITHFPKGRITMKSYVFHAELEQEEDGRWSAWIDVLPGCATWGYNREEALDALKEAAQAYLEVLVEKGALIMDISKGPLNRVGPRAIGREKQQLHAGMT